jgi:hypothetical protein
MKLKFKLSILVMAILIAVDLNRHMIEFWKGRQERRLSMLNTLENVFSQYHRLPQLSRESEGLMK